MVIGEIPTHGTDHGRDDSNEDRGHVSQSPSANDHHAGDEPPPSPQPGKSITKVTIMTEITRELMRGLEVLDVNALRLFQQDLRAFKEQWLGRVTKEMACHE
jgi:hypothetical protein